MNAIENQVRELVKVELDAANERFPQFHSQHEGYAVILEEVDELRTETGETDEFLCFLWSAIKANDLEETKRYILNIKRSAINAACEAIQVAAMCRKFLEMKEEKR